MMAGGLGGSIAELALEAWVDCKPQGYVVEERCILSLLPAIASKVPSLEDDPCKGGPGELFRSLKPGDQPLFCRLLRAQAGKVHFLYFWKAFGEAARIAGSHPDEGLTSELETLRDGVLRRFEEPVRSPLAECRSSSSSFRCAWKESAAATKVPLLQRTIPTDALVEEVHRAASMSACPHFWQAVTGTLVGQDELQELGLEELTSVLLSWLHDAAMWQHRRGSASRSNPGNSRRDTDPDDHLLVRLHIYDVSQEESIQRINRILAHTYAPLKLGGVFHAGVEVNGLEWSFGFCSSETRSGVSCVKPTMHPQHHYRQTVVLKRAKVSPEEITRIMSDLIEEYPGDDYDLLRRNCCHFADDFCKRLGVGGIPGWVHRLARMGASLDNMLQNAPQPIRDRIYG